MPKQSANAGTGIEVIVTNVRNNRRIVPDYLLIGRSEARGGPGNNPTFSQLLQVLGRLWKTRAIGAKIPV
jgi:hypothetical protein